ncbi:membrane integrity-associated transporter subunit PqiC [Acinetobacter chinensis]|uniref:Membrane integrity-associated transporter subunit PqiC n=1 Tax=Acinetobacter chinensis TaxID=2004650 RepID=A0A3B7LYE2_9GAMM|nr:PqiC family protein [Acinetobacter chinensis]AXY57045.1 membrane integrity-associated transporter subunit PqiC [Acinetobacter chinensis]
MTIDHKIKIKFYRKSVLLHVIVGLFGGVLTACSTSAPPNYYSLNGKIPVATPLHQTNQLMMIEVLPVGLADRLNRIPIVIFEANGKSKVLNENRWTSTLAAELRDGLSSGLQQKLGAIDRYNSGMSGGKTTYRIATDFSRFDFIDNQGTANVNNKNEIAVAVNWTIKLDQVNHPLTTAKNETKPVQSNTFSCRMVFTQPVAKHQGGIVDLVNSSKDALDQVVDGVASSILNIEDRRKNLKSGVLCN